MLMGIDFSHFFHQMNLFFSCQNDARRGCKIQFARDWPCYYSRVCHQVCSLLCKLFFFYMLLMFSLKWSWNCSSHVNLIIATSQTCSCYTIFCLNACIPPFITLLKISALILIFLKHKGCCIDHYTWVAYHSEITLRIIWRSTFKWYFQLLTSIWYNIQCWRNTAPS